MLNLRKLQRYRTLTETECILPVGWGRDKKAPCIKKGWQLNPEYSLEEICNFKDAIALGITTRNLWVLDLDGDSSVRWARNKGLLESYSWEIHRTTSAVYWKKVWRPTEKQIAQLPTNDDGNKEFQFKVRTNPCNFLNEAAEFFMAHNRQIIFYGKHWKSGGDYYSPPHRDFGDIAAPNDWEWKVCLEEVYKHQEKLPRKRSKTHGKDWFTLDVCPICNRSSANVCQMHRDEKTVRCFKGITYHPPKNLKPGEVIHDNWAFCRSQYVGWGDFAIFTQHKPTPTQLSFRRWRSV